MFLNRNFPACWEFHFRSRRSQTFGRSKEIRSKNCCVLEVKFFRWDILEAKKMTLVTAKSIKVFDGLLISDRDASWDEKITDDQNSK